MTTIKFRRDTSTNWTSVNPIPAQGEPCYETDTGKLKIGNGSDNYVTLPYVSDGGGSAGDLPIATATTLGGVKIGENLSITEDGTLSATGGSAGTTDYTQLENKPQINSVELTGNKTLNDLGIQAKGNYQPAGDYATTADIPTKTSELTNDSGFLTEAPIPTNMVTTDTDQTISGSKTFTQGITATDITCGDTLTASNIRTTANGTIKLAHPMNNASGLITFSNDYGQLSISSSLGGNNNLLGVVRGTAYALINGDNITTRDKDGNERIYINTQNIDTTYMKWDSTNKKLKVDTAAVAGLAMPSKTKIDLTLGASGTTYTAPTSGWVAIQGTLTANNGWVALVTTTLGTWLQQPTNGYNLANYIPIHKDDILSVHYENVTPVYFHFAYAVGAVPTNT